MSASPSKSIIHHNYNKTQGFSKQEPETIQQNSLKDKTINACKHATPLYKADIFRVILDTLSTDTKQSANFLQDSFLQSWVVRWPWLCRNVYDYSRRKRLFSHIRLSPQIKWLLLHAHTQKGWCLPLYWVHVVTGQNIVLKWQIFQNHNWSQKHYILSESSPT